MGTRNLTKVIKDGKIVVAQYGQWDGYPSGQGLTGLFSVMSEDIIAGLEANLNLIYYPSEDELLEMWKPFTGRAHAEGWVTLEEGKAFGAKYPSLTRDTGTEILQVISKATEPVPLKLEIEFEEDDLFCEGVYEVNLDNKTYRSVFDQYEIVITFDEARELGVEGYLAKFGYDEENINRVINSLSVNA
jgi:hypothetical protein